jgi:hypothetical protein
MSKVIPLGQATPERALEGLNRLTGLVFDQWPESLIHGNTSAVPAENNSGRDDSSRPTPVVRAISQRLGNG